MSAILALLPLVLAQSPVIVSGSPPTGPERSDVAYEEMAAGESDAAITRILANRKLGNDDPARLLNLGTAYARLGDTRRARDLFHAAMFSPDRYELELADGRWVDSRDASRMAIALLAERRTLALR